MTVFTWLWVGWGVLFGIVEGIALTNGRYHGTLSAHLWAWFGYDREGRKSRKGWARVRRFALVAFLLWLILHLATGGWY